MSDAPSVADRVRKVIGAQVDRPAAEITDDMSLQRDLRLDSLDYVNMTVLLLEEFGDTFEPGEIEADTVGDVVKFMEGKVSG